MVVLATACTSAGHRTANPGPTSTTTSRDGPARWAGTWSAMAASPLSTRAGVASAWTGSRLLIWGGFRFAGSDEVELGDGAAYDPAGDRWTPISPSPLAPRSRAIGVWDGQELLVWGGEGLTRCCLADGAAYNPTSDRWTPLPPSPLRSDLRSTARGVWAGGELVIWSGDPGVGAAYDPRSRHWRTLPGAPLGARSDPLVAWDGRELIVAGGFAGDTTSSALLDAAAYDPDFDRWRPLPVMPAWPERSVLTSGGLIVQAHRTDAPNGAPELLQLDGPANRWNVLPDPPGSVVPVPPGTPPYANPVLNPQALLWTGTMVLVPGWYGAGIAPSDTGGAAFDMATRRWRVLATGVGSSAGNGAYAWTGTKLLEWGGQGWGAGATTNDGVIFEPGHA